MTKCNRLLQLLNYRLKICTVEGKTLVGQMIAFDKHMNIVLADCNEFRSIRPKKETSKPKEEKRTLGLVILRGENIVSMIVESGPPPTYDSKARGPASAILSGKAAATAMRGQAMPAAAQQQPFAYGARLPQPGMMPPMPGIPGMMPSMPGMPPAAMMPLMPSLMPPVPGMPGSGAYQQQPKN